MIGDMSKHESPASLIRNSSATPAAWAVLIGMGATSVTFNIYHSLTAYQWPLGLALLYGIAPVFTAFCLSHVVAAHKGGWVMQVFLYLVVLGAMSMSIGSVAVVVAPVAGSHLKWLFGAVIDGSALVALRVVLAERERMGRDVVALEAAMTSAQEAGERAVSLEGELERLREELGGELGKVRGELERAQGALAQSSAVATAKRASGARKAASGKRRAGASGRDIDTQTEALALYLGNPEITGSDLGRELGLSPSRGRAILQSLKSEAPHTGPIQRVEAS